MPNRFFSFRTVNRDDLEVPGGQNEVHPFAVTPDGRRQKEMSAWLFLAGAILLEVAGTISMKLSNGFSNLLPSAALFFFYGGAFTLLNFALKKIELSTAYAIWSGAGTAIVAALGFIFFKDSLTAGKIICIGLIIAGVVGLELSGGA